MKKHMIIGVFILLLISCTKQSNQEINSNKIVYVLNEELTNDILEEYNNLKNKRDYYVTFNVGICCVGNDRMIRLENGDDDKKIKILLKKTNRFLKLQENIFVPVISITDILFEEDTKNLLTSSLGKNGSIYFILDGKDRLVEIR